MPRPVPSGSVSEPVPAWLRVAEEAERAPVGTRERGRWPDAKFGGCWEQKPRLTRGLESEVWSPGRPCRSLAVGSSVRFCDQAAGWGAIPGVAGWEMLQPPYWLCHLGAATPLVVKAQFAEHSLSVACVLGVWTRA